MNNALCSLHFRQANFGQFNSLRNLSIFSRYLGRGRAVRTARSFKGHQPKIFVFFPGHKYTIWAPIMIAQAIYSLTLVISFLYLLFLWRYSSFTEGPQISQF